MTDSLDLPVRGLSPIARLVLREQMTDSFDADDDVPFMMKVHPIRLEKALDCFLRTDMDVLVLGPWVVRKEGARAGAVGEDRPEEAAGSDAR